MHGGGRRKFYLALRARSRALVLLAGSPMSSKKERKKIKHTSVFRLGLYGIFPGNFKFGARHFLNGFKLKLFNFNSE